MKKLILVCVLCAIAAPAQNIPQNVQRVFQLKYAEPNEVKALLVGAFPVNINPVNPLHMIAVSATKETMAAVEEALKTIDVPPPARRNIEITGYLILASGQAATAPEPAELTGVVKQMRSLFPYKSYRVVETMLIRGRDGQNSSTSGYLADADNPRWRYEFSYRGSINAVDHLIRMDNMHLRILLDQTQFNLGTDVDLREGQKVVVGKSNAFGGDSALVLVLTAKLVD